MSQAEAPTPYRHKKLSGFGCEKTFQEKEENLLEAVKMGKTRNDRLLCIHGSLFEL